MKRTGEIATEVAVLMPRVGKGILLKFFQSFEISQAQLFAVMTLYENGPCRFSQLSRELHIAPPTVTGLVDRLEDAGYVIRSPDKSDRRATQVTLTARGIKIARRLRETVTRKWKGILSKLPPDEQETYLRILKKIEANL